MGSLPLIASNLDAEPTPDALRAMQRSLDGVPERWRHADLAWWPAMAGIAAQQLQLRRNRWRSRHECPRNGDVSFLHTLAVFSILRALKRSRDAAAGPVAPKN
jgi:hypothetical protein